MSIFFWGFFRFFPAFYALLSLHSSTCFFWFKPGEKSLPSRHWYCSKAGKFSRFCGQLCRKECIFHVRFHIFFTKKDLLPKAGLFQTPLTVDSWLLTFYLLYPGVLLIKAMNTKSSLPVFFSPWVPPSSQKVTSPAFTVSFLSSSVYSPSPLSR